MHVVEGVLSHQLKQFVIDGNKVRTARMQHGGGITSLGRARHVRLKHALAHAIRYRPSQTSEACMSCGPLPRWDGKLGHHS